MSRRTRIIPSQSKRFTEKRHRRVLVISGLVFLCFTLFTFMISRASTLDYFAIKTVNVYGADKDIVPALRAAAMEAISGKYFGLFSKANIFTYPKEDVRLAVSSASNRISDVSLNNEGLNVLSITVSEKTPAAVICESLPDFNGDNISPIDDGSCYLADSSGFVYDSVASSSIIASNKYFIPNASTTGSYPILTDEFSALQSFYGGVRQAGLDPQAILVKDGGECEMYASTTVIYFNYRKSLPEELSNLISFWSEKTKAANAAGKILNLDYIDVRYSPNVYYR